MTEEQYNDLKISDPCPNCQLGEGLRIAYAYELAWTGWDNYSFLHCDTCGVYFVTRDNKEWKRLSAASPSS